MCDYSLESFRSRPAKVADRLVLRNFGTGTTGFADPEALDCAVCLKPGTELAFDAPLKTMLGQSGYTVALFTQLDTDRRHVHHDALEFPDGERTKLQLLFPMQYATVLQLPVEGHAEAEHDQISEPVPEVA